MSNVGVHDFAIPHEHVQPTRDMVIVRLPLPPKQSAGGIELPDVFRDMAQYNVMVGRVVAMGPMAFTYKDGEGLKKHDVNIGDWVVFRPFAGTQTMGGKVAGAGTWRHISSFQDVIGVIPVDKMPHPDTLLWDDTKEKPKAAAKTADQFPNNVRETVKVK